eukprot:GHVS01045633.1.p1 GENE.GHVS01045633.1~~GHVS01045633.1.p1  ORF type:complete len:296 (-),score=32.25 GHVS01045633.1:65-952(-)
MHAATQIAEGPNLSKNVLETTAMCMACGVDPNLSIVFVQSQVPAHAEMSWILGCITPHSWLTRMVQYKERKRKGLTFALSSATFSYPLLMAADILLYKSDFVCVGRDQIQHIELARDVARRFNSHFATPHMRAPLLVEPSIFSTPVEYTVKSLTNAKCKMSKSGVSELSRVNLADSPDVIRDKIRACKTDDWPVLCPPPLCALPERVNLLSLFCALTHTDVREAFSAHVGWETFKHVLADAVVQTLQPIQLKYREYVKDVEYLHQVLKRGKAQANEIANKTLQEVRDAVGFLREP